MIIHHPKVFVDLGNPSRLPARNDNDSGPLRPWRSWVKRQDNLPPCPTVGHVPCSPSVAPPPFVSSSPPVVTSPTPTPSSEGLDPTSPSPNIPLETSLISSSSNTPPPESTPSCSGPQGSTTSMPEVPIPPRPTENSAETTTQFTHPPSPIPTTFVSDESSKFPSTTTPTNVVIHGRLDPNPRLSSTTTNTDTITPDISLDVTGQGEIVTRNRMVGAIVGSVLMLGLVIFGVIFYLRRRMRRRSLRQVVDTTRATSNMPSCPAPSQTMEKQESGTIMQDWNAFLDRSGAAIRDSALTVAEIQMQCSHLDRYSQISASSTISMSIRFAVPGSHHSPTNSYSSRGTASVTPRDAARTSTANPFADHASPPQSPASMKTPTNHSAPWRGTNLSNIINAARGVKV